jgi:integrase
VEFVVPETGQKLTARSTGTTDRDEAILKISEWLRGGIPAGRGRRARSLEDTASLETIIRSVRKAPLTPDDALQIMAVLRERELVDFPAIKYNRASETSISDFLTLFWDYENSPYVREKRAYRHSLGKNYCMNSMYNVKKYWAPFFGDKTIGKITRADLKEFSMYVAEKGLSPGSINRIMVTGTIPLRWAFKEGTIPVDPSLGINNFVGGVRERGVLTPIEAAAVFSAKWDNKRVYIGNVLSCLTGMRLGEVLALRLEDIEGYHINLSHSWSIHDSLKTTKTGKTRQVPIYPEIKEKLLELANENPYGKDGFIFYGSKKDSPMNSRLLSVGLNDTCDFVDNNPPGWVIDPDEANGDGYLWEVSSRKDKDGNLLDKWSDPVRVDVGGVNKEAGIDVSGGYTDRRYRKSFGKPENPIFINRKVRNIVFHSHRHYYAARMTDRMTAEQVSRITGHDSMAVFKNYSDHIISENLEQAAEIGTQVFGGILEACKGA